MEKTHQLIFLSKNPANLNFKIYRQPMNSYLSPFLIYLKYKHDKYGNLLDLYCPNSKMSCLHNDYSQVAQGLGSTKDYLFIRYSITFSENVVYANLK